ncbi:hypothetical protein ACFFVB_12640 [Formosa undariae]|uniref:DUF4935 domain-containing protein n=1 Tax=Formosa undariae TaxID=1325436 RepID=A0ABV5F399_9FLAO
MKTICDTNIWRGLMEKEITEFELSSLNSPLTLSFINIDEIAKSNLILSDIGKSRVVIQRMMQMSAMKIYDPPLIYLKKMDTDDFQYNSPEKHIDMLHITNAIANGQGINESNFKSYKKRRETVFVDLCNIINKESEKIRKSTTHTYEKLDSKVINRDFISFIVKSQTGINLSNEFDWSQIELFEGVLSLFFKELETTKAKIKPNDIYDLFILIYVQPNDEFWSVDIKKGPLKYVNKIADGKYLYGNNIA